MTRAKKWGADRKFGSQQGFSLVEMMVAMAVSLVLLLGVSNVIISSNQSYDELTRAGQRLENGRYALQVMRDDIRHAGFFGEFSDLIMPAAMPNACSVSLSDLDSAIGAPLQGFAAGATAPIACLPGYSGGDVLVIRRASTQAVLPSALDVDDVYIQSRPEAVQVNLGVASNFTLSQRDGITPATIRKYVTHIYYIRNCSNCTAGDGIPSLWMRELESGSLTSLPIAEGIENLQLRYGVDDNGDGSADRYLVLPSTPAEWEDVVTVEINLLARASETSPGFTDTKNYVLGDVTVSPGGAFKRHAFNSVVSAVNLGGRREM